MNDTEIAFFRPLWRRLALLVVCALWSLLEWRAGATLWSALSLGLCAYVLWAYFLRFPGADD